MRGARVGAAEQVEQHRADDPLELGIAVEHDVGLPAAGPGAGVVGRQAVVSARRAPLPRGVRPRAAGLPVSPDVANPTSWVKM